MASRKRPPRSNQKPIKVKLQKDLHSVTKVQSPNGRLAALRKKAKKQLGEQSARLDRLSKQDMKHLVTELETYQIELEMQNEELRYAQMEIESSHRKYSDLFDFSPVGYFTFSKDGLIQEVNHTGVGMLGMEKRFLIGKPILNFIEPRDRALFREHLTEVFRTQTRTTTEINLRGKKGVPFPAQLQSISADSGKGTNDSCRTVVIDISIRKREEAAAQEREDRLRLALDAGAMGMWDWTVPDGKVIWNDAHYRMLGYGPGTVTPSYDAWAARVHPDDLAVATTKVNTSLKRGGDFSSEFRVVWPDGTLRWIEARGCANLDAAGRPVRNYGVMMDVTERKLSEEALKKSEERFKQMVENVGDFIWEVDVNGVYRYTGPSVENILGYTTDELIGKMHFYDLFARENREELKAAVFSMFAAKQSFRAFSHTNVNKDGKIVRLESSGVPVLDENGNLVGYRGADIDVTERKRMEEQLQLRFLEIVQLKEELERENVLLRSEASLIFEHGDIVGESAVMKAVLAQAEQVAQTDSTVLITGETGTGKELLAREIHNMSSRKALPLVTVNCASLPATLIESELFGREKGAYTGAMTRMAGRFEIADGSTIFLDEIAELPLDLQSKLLRVIEEGRFERLGSTKTINVNVRIIAATSRDISQQKQQDTFRRDLFYRLNVFPIHIPPLRERLEDIPFLVWAFVRHFEKKMGKQINSIRQRGLQELQRYPWPGNIRELKNVIEHAMIVTDDNILDVRAPAASVADHAEDDKLDLESAERKHILTALQRCGWRIDGSGGAAQALGLKRTTLQSKMKKLGIERPTN